MTKQELDMILKSVPSNTEIAIDGYRIKEVKSITYRKLGNRSIITLSEGKEIKEEEAEEDDD